MRHRIKTLALLIVLPFVITACTVQDIPVIGGLIGGGGGTSDDPVTLTWWGLWESQEVIDQLVAAYQTANPNVTIAYEDRSVLDVLSYKDRVYTRAVEPDSPDIMRVHNTWVKRMHANGFLSAMPSNLMDTSTYNSTFYPVASESAVINNQIYGIPLFYDGLVLVYNKSHFNEIGQVEPPSAWEEFRRLALELTIRGGNRGNEVIRAGAAVGSADNVDHFPDILGLMWAQAGVSVPEDLSSKSAQDALTFYTNFLTEDKVWRADFPESVDAFVEGRVSMVFVPTWRILDILKVMDDATIVGVAPVPQALADNPANWGTFWMEVVPVGSQNQPEAWKFLKFLTEQEQQLLMFSENSKARFFGSPYSRADLGNELSTNPFLAPAVETAPTAKGVAEIAGRAGNNRQNTALGDAISSVISGTSAKEALEQFKTEF
ncbi:MAG: ABC transporter substrate-binding protein [Patescibacteria group bacterium]